VFFLGIFLAAIAAIIVFVAISGADSGTGGDVAVVTAKETIPAQTRITSDMLQVKFFSSDDALGDAFSNRSQLVDRVATQDIAADAQVLPSMVSDTAGDGIPFKVSPGMRAVSVDVEEVVTVGGNVQPGDRIDIVGIFATENVEAANHLLAQLGVDKTVVAPAAPEEDDGGFVGGGNLTLTVTMLQNIKLLALAQTITDTTSGGKLADTVDKSDSDDADPSAASATLELTPKQAQDIILADQFGILRFEARPVGESSIQDVQPTLVNVDRTR
jgi:pilus assembly protein CpaB